MNNKPTYQELENQIVELKKQNEFLHLNFSAQCEEKEKYEDELAIINKRNQEYIELINELTKTKENIEESKDKYKFLAENIVDVIWILNLNQYKFIYVSPSIIHLTGFTAEEAMKQTISELLDSATEQIFRIKTKAALQLFLKNPNQRQIYYNEIQNICKNGSLIWVETNTRFQFAKNGDIELLGVSRNIQKRKETERALKESENQLRELNATKDKLFSIIAHDLRSPFNCILGYAEFLLEDVKAYDSPELENSLGIIRSLSENTLVLLDNLLNWAKSQTGQINFNPEKLIISDIVLKIIELKKLPADAKNISLNYSSLAELEVQADKNMLSTILRNLISNAIKFTNVNGKINITASQNNNFIEIIVSDNGIGMNKEIRNNIFSLETNTTSIGTANEKGSGLGLIICKEFVEKHGGKIWVESKEGKGSNFIFTLPFCND